MPKLNLNLPMFQMVIQCNSCQYKMVVDKRAWDIDYWYINEFCPNCSPNNKKNFSVTDVHKTSDHVPLKQGENDPNDAKTYAILFVKTGGWIAQGYRNYRTIHNSNYGDLNKVPQAVQLDRARVFTGLRSAKSTISRFINRSGKVLTRNDFKVFEVNSIPTQEIIL